MVVRGNLADRLVEILGEQRLGVFGLGGDLLGLVHDLVELGLALLELLHEFLGGVAIRQAAALAGGVRRGDGIGDLAHLAGKRAGLGAQVAHLLLELAGGLFAQILPGLLEAALGPGAGGEGLRR